MVFIEVLLSNIGDRRNILLEENKIERSKVGNTSNNSRLW